jgi:hypothetical protein
MPSGDQTQGTGPWDAHWNNCANGIPTGRVPARRWPPIRGARPSCLAKRLNIDKPRDERGVHQSQS